MDVVVRGSQIIVFRIFSYVNATNSAASNGEKLFRPFYGVPTHLKKYFIRNNPTTIEEFTETIKDVKREQLHDQKLLLQQFSQSFSMSNPNLSTPFA